MESKTINARPLLKHHQEDPHTIKAILLIHENLKDHQWKQQQGSPSHNTAKTVCQIHTLRAQTITAKPHQTTRNRKLSSYVHLNTDILRHSIQPLHPNSKAQDLWHYRTHMLAAHYDAVDTFQLLYRHQLQARKVIGYRLHTTSKRKVGEQDTADQEQYLTEYEPLIMENWAIPLLDEIPEIKVLTKDPIPRSELTDASCEVCCNPGTYEEPHKDHPTTDMYECDVCNRTYHWKCLVQLQCYTEEQRRVVMEDEHWCCPACSNLDKREKEERHRKSEHELMQVTWSPIWEPKDQMDVWESFKEKVEEFEAEQVTPPLDLELDNLERQGFQVNSEGTYQWQSTQGHSIRSKATFDMQPTNPQVDIKATGQCEVWVRDVEVVHIKDAHQPTNRSDRISPHNPASFPTTQMVKAACVYNPEGKCIGMMTPERMHLLKSCFDDAQAQGMHAGMTPPVHTFASELAGLLSERNKRLNPKGSTVTKTTRESPSRILPGHITTAFQKWACVTKEKMASALDFAPHVPSYWSERHRDRVFGANYNAFATKFTGFSMCHPNYDDQLMFNSVQHAIRSARHATSPTATFMFLPNWANMSLNPYMQLFDENPDHCTYLGMIPQARLHYDEPTAWNGGRPTLPRPTWSLDIIVVWNAAAREQLCTTNQNWLSNLQQEIPGALWSPAHRPSWVRSLTGRYDAPPALPQVFLSKRDDSADAILSCAATFHHNP